MVKLVNIIELEAIKPTLAIIYVFHAERNEKFVSKDLGLIV